jgi:hypothetical protein
MPHRGYPNRTIDDERVTPTGHWRFFKLFYKQVAPLGHRIGSPISRYVTVLWGAETSSAGYEITKKAIQRC